MYLAFTIALNVLLCVGFAIAVPVLIALRRSRTRDVDTWVEDAHTAWNRGERQTAVRLLQQSMTFPASGTYEAAQASATSRAIDALAGLWPEPLPDAIPHLRAALSSGADVPSETVANAQAALSEMVETLA